MVSWLQSILNWFKPSPVVLKGSAYPWTATIDGNDIVVSDVHATWFGGSDDPEDDGQTASGVSTALAPNYLGCALPLNYGPCSGSPIPRGIPWMTQVKVTNLDNEKQITVALIDLGPSPPPRATAAIDLTQAAFVDLGGDLKDGTMSISYRVIGGAQYVPKTS